jgi:signal transduction histidine kinase
MELCVMLTKLILVVYIAFLCIQSEIKNTAWIVLSILLFLCVNLPVYLVKRDQVKNSIHFLSIILTIALSFYVHPLFILLLPTNLWELGSPYIEQTGKLYIFALIPLLFIERSMYPIYGLVSSLSFLIFAIVKLYTDKLEKYENEIDKLRKDRQRLTGSLNENSEYIRQSEYTIKLEERNRISQEIHDKIGHSMTGALIQMEAAKRLIDRDQEKAIGLLQNAIHISKEGIENIRITLKNMKPPTEQMGINRMKLFIDEFEAKQDCQISLLHHGDLDRITPIQWKIIQENVTEALTNAMKYASATAVFVEIKVLNTIVKVEVKDNGCGTAQIKKGLGIMGMEERAASINGTVIVDGTNGFTVTTLLPI